MNEPSPPSRRRTGVGIGEIIGILALVVSAVGVWISWQSANRNPEPTKIIEERRAIPLSLRARVEDDGRALIIAPVEASHALDRLTLTIAGQPPTEVGSDGRLSAGDLQRIVPKSEAKGTQSVPVRIDTRYVEAGQDRRASNTYRLRYRWEGGGLFSGRSLRLVGLSRA